MDGADRRVRTSIGSLIIPPPPTSTPPLPPQDDDNAPFINLHHRPSNPLRLPPLDPLVPLLPPPAMHGPEVTLSAASAEATPASPLAMEKGDACRVTKASATHSEWLSSPTSPTYQVSISPSSTPVPPSPTCQTPTPLAVAQPAEALAPPSNGMLSATSASSTVPSPETTSEPSSPSSPSSLVSRLSSGYCSCREVETGENPTPCSCSYHARLTLWVHEQTHLAELDEETPEAEAEVPALALDPKVANAARPVLGIRSGQQGNKWYWQSNTASFQSSSGRQSWEDHNQNVRADSPLLGDFTFDNTPAEAGPSSRVIDTDAVVRKPSPPLLRTACLDQSSSLPSPGTGPNAVASPTDTFVSAVSGSSESTAGQGDDDSTISGHTVAHSGDGHNALGRNRSQSASVVHALSQQPRRGGHAHSASVSTVYGPGDGDLQHRYQTALGLEHRATGLEPAFELARSMNAHGDSVGEPPSMSNPVPNPLQSLLSTPPSMSPGLTAPPPTATSLTTPLTPRSPRSPSHLGTPRTPRTPPTLSTQPSMASLRHAVYIIDSEEVRERLDELVRRESMSSLASMAVQQQTESTSPPLPASARYGRSRSHSLVSVVESEDEEREDVYGREWRSREDEFGLHGDVTLQAEDDDDDDRRNTVYGSSIDGVVQAMGLDKIDPIRNSRERSAGLSQPQADLVYDVDYRTYLSERFVEDVEQVDTDEEEDSEEERARVRHNFDDDDLEQFRDLFYRPSNPRPPLSHSVSVPAIPQANSSGSSHSGSPAKHTHSHSVAFTPATTGFYQSEEASSSRVYVGPNTQAKGHQHTPSFASSTSNSTRSSRSYGTAPLHSPTSPAAAAALSRSGSMSTGPLSQNPSMNRMPSHTTLQHKKSQPSLSGVARSRPPSAINAGRSRAGSVTATTARSRAGSFTRPPPLDISAVSIAMALDVLPSPAIEAVSASIRDSVAVGPPPRRPPPAPPLGVESAVHDVIDEASESGLVSTEEFGYFPTQPTPPVMDEADADATVRGRSQVQVLSSRWSNASSSQESLDLKEKEKAVKKKEKSKSAPSSPGSKRKSMFGNDNNGENVEREQPVIGKRGRLASFISKLRGQDKGKTDKEKDSRKSGDITDDGEDIIHIKGSWEAVPPVPPVPANPPPLPPSLRSKMSAMSLRGGLAREDTWPSVPPTPSTFISDWDASPSRPESAVPSSPRNSKTYPQPIPPNTKRLSSTPQSLNRARSHSHLSIMSSATSVAPFVQHHTSPPPSPSHNQASFGHSSSMASLGLAPPAALSPPLSAGFYAAGAGFPRSVTSSPRSSFAYPTVQVAQSHVSTHLPIGQASTSPLPSSPLAANSVDRLAAPASYGSPGTDKRLTLSSVASTLDLSNSGHSHGPPQTPNSNVDFSGAALASESKTLFAARLGNPRLAYADEEDEMDSESLLLEEAKDIMEAHSYMYDCGISEGGRRESNQDVIPDAEEPFDVMDVYSQDSRASPIRHSRSLSGTQSTSHSSTHSRSSSVLRLKDPAPAIVPTIRPRRLAPSVSSPDVSRRSNGGQGVPPPPVPPKDDTYEVLTTIANHRQKLSLIPVDIPSMPSPTSGSVSPSTQAPGSHVRFPAPVSRQTSEANHSIASGLSSGSSGSGRSTPATNKVGSFMTRLRLKSSPSLGSLKTPPYVSSTVHAAGYMPLESPHRPSPTSRVTTPAVPTLPDSAKSPKSGAKFGSSFAKMMGKGRDKKKSYDDADLDDELKTIDPSFMMGGAGGMIGVPAGTAKKVPKQKKVPTKEELELDAELKRADGSMIGGPAMIGIGG